MTIRITTQTGVNGTTVFVEGRLSASAARELGEECQSIDAPLRLDLSGLKSAEPAGISCLRSLSAAGAELYGASIYIKQLLALSSE